LARGLLHRVMHLFGGASTFMPVAKGFRTRLWLLCRCVLSRRPPIRLSPSGRRYNARPLGPVRLNALVSFFSFGAAFFRTSAPALDFLRFFARRALRGMGPSALPFGFRGPCYSRAIVVRPPEPVCRSLVAVSVGRRSRRQRAAVGFSLWCRSNFALHGVFSHSPVASSPLLSRPPGVPFLIFQGPLMRESFLSPPRSRLRARASLVRFRLPCRPASSHAGSAFALAPVIVCCSLPCFRGHRSPPPACGHGPFRLLGGLAWTCRPLSAPVSPGGFDLPHAPLGVSRGEAHPVFRRDALFAFGEPISPIGFDVIYDHAGDVCYFSPWVCSGCYEIGVRFWVVRLLSGWHGGCASVGGWVIRYAVWGWLWLGCP